jgi:hypothetical protein
LETAREVVMTRRISIIAALGLGVSLAGACDKETTPPAPVAAPAPAAAPAVAPPASAPRPKMVANPDGLSLSERIAKREAAEKKVAAGLALEEHDRLVKYDRGKLPLHTQVFAFITKVRTEDDKLEKQVLAESDKAKAKAQIEKAAGGQRAGIVAMDKKMATIDPKGGNSNITTDYDVMLNALANDYPEAMVAAVDGDPKPLAEQKAELDKRTKKITDWFAELRAAKK